MANVLENSASVSEARYDGVVRLGALYRDDQPVVRAQRPWLIDLSVLAPYPGLPVGDIADFETAPSFQHWHLGDTPADQASQLQWIKLSCGSRTLLICDRMILARISWDDLEAEGYVQGRRIEIDGHSYLCRLLTGGSHFRKGDDGYAGGTPLNEWDRYVAGEETVDGLPAPSKSDLDETLSESDRLGSHNQLWNWFGAVSWTQEPYAEKATARCCRGFRSARYFYLNTQSHRHEDIGWRPVLEPM